MQRDGWIGKNVSGNTKLFLNLKSENTGKKWKKILKKILKNTEKILEKNTEKKLNQTWLV